MGKKKSKRTKPSATGAKRARQKQEEDLVKEAKGEEIVNPPAAEASAQREPSENQLFPIVAIGASAGGLEAFTQVLEHLPTNTGMAFVFIQHLDPKHESMLTELLSRSTRIPVKQVKEGMQVEPDHVYVIPPNTNMVIENKTLKLVPRIATRGQHMPIDYFMRSLAKSIGDRAIGVILSGTASDGALGLEAIKAEGGITFAQDEKSAKYQGMPRSAVATGCVDFILSPEMIAKELIRIGRHPYVYSQTEQTDKPLSKREEDLNKIFILLGIATGVDFTYYKHTTVKRRILRRMALHKIEKLKDYVKHLQDNPAEVEELYQDILIKVTNFFRDPEAFEALKEKVFPRILENRSADAPIRVWVPGCATGEEAYSIAISLLEFLADKVTAVPIQIFATDISEAALDKAHVGVYIENIALDVSAERLRRFFNKVDRGYQISKTVRDLCVFAKQNVAKDPPFSKLDLISCRNVLIYLGPVLQKRVVPIFHYALKPTGFLMLGTSETIGAFSELFDLLDRKHKIYARKAATSRLVHDFSVDIHTVEAEKLEKARSINEDLWKGFDVQREADRIVLGRYAPAGVIINDSMDILQFRGQTSPYLEPAPGKASLNLLKMAREGLLLPLRTAIQKAKKSGTPAREEDIRFQYNDQFININIEVTPIKAPPNSKERCLLVLFEDVTSFIKPKVAKSKSQKALIKERRAEHIQVRSLQQELAATKEYLQSIIEEQEATNEELKSANEEILSGNEELQSTNEELETAKEELQSTNEELSTVNDALQNRNAELSQLNNDLSNLLSSVNISIVMLGSDLRIRLYTPMAEKVLNLISTDIGRPITDIKPNIIVPDLGNILLEVIDDMKTVEREVQDQAGGWYSLRIRPYKAAENKIDGVVIALVDIDAVKRGVEALKESREKGVLLKEIHHRVKNNLQIISSLLNLQSGYIKDEKTLDMFKESQNRVKSMALIHEILYESKNLVRIDFMEYIQNLVAHLFRTYGVDPDNITLKIETGNARPSIDTAIPCGLIINELVSNSMKYAFPQGQKGEIRIELRPETNSKLSLTVSDNGVGLPKDLDLQNTETLGLQLVMTLVNQLGGTIAMNRNNGTEFKIKFAELRYKERS